MTARFANISKSMKEIPIEALVKLSGISRRALINIRAGRSQPHSKNRETLVSILKSLGLDFRFPLLWHRSRSWVNQIEEHSLRTNVGPRVWSNETNETCVDLKLRAT